MMTKNFARLRATLSGMLNLTPPEPSRPSMLIQLSHRSAVEGWSRATPEVPKWTKETVAQHITVGGLGATAVGTGAQVADEIERWVNEADVDGFNFVRLLKQHLMS